MTRFHQRRVPSPTFSRVDHDRPSLAPLCKQYMLRADMSGKSLIPKSLHHISIILWNRRFKCLKSLVTASKPTKHQNLTCRQLQYIPLRRCWGATCCTGDRTAAKSPCYSGHFQCLGGDPLGGSCRKTQWKSWFRCFECSLHFIAHGKLDGILLDLEQRLPTKGMLEMLAAPLHFIPKYCLRKPMRIISTLVGTWLRLITWYMKLTYFQEDSEDIKANTEMLGCS